MPVGRKTGTLEIEKLCLKYVAMDSEASIRSTTSQWHNTKQLMETYSDLVTHSRRSSQYATTYNRCGVKASHTPTRREPAEQPPPGKHCVIGTVHYERCRLLSPTTGTPIEALYTTPGNRCCRIGDVKVPIYRPAYVTSRLSLRVLRTRYRTEGNCG